MFFPESLSSDSFLLDIVNLKNTFASDEEFATIEFPEDVIAAIDRGRNPDHFTADCVINAAEQYKLTNMKRETVDAVRDALLEKATALYPQQAEEYKRLRNIKPKGAAHDPPPQQRDHQ